MPRPPSGPGGGAGMTTILTVGRAVDGAALDGALTAAGHRVVRAGTAREALARARGETPDLVLVDGPFSARASSDLVARLRAEPATARLPIVLLEPSSSVSACLAALGQLGLDPARQPAPHARGEPGYRTLFQNSISGIGLHEIVTDPQGRPIDYVFLDVNPAFEELAGLRREDVLGRRATEVLPGSGQESLIEIFGRVALTGEAARFEQHSPPLDRYYDIVAFGWGRGRFAAVFTDVTEQRRAGEQLRLQGAALEAAANAIVITDREGRITWANPAFTQLTGWSLDEVRGLSPRILKSGQHDPAFYEELWRTILSGQVWQGEMVNRRKDGSFYYEEQTITPVRGPGKGETTNFVGVKVDVSERRAVRESPRPERAPVPEAGRGGPRRHFHRGPGGPRPLLEHGRGDQARAAPRGRGGEATGRGAAPRGRGAVPPECRARLRERRGSLRRGDDPLLDGREIWSGTWLTPLTGEGGGIESVEAVSRDITTRVAAEQALRASEQRYRSLFERNLAGVYRTTLEGRIVECNDAFARVLGYASGAEVRGLSAGDLYPTPALRQSVRREAPVRGDAREPRVGRPEEGRHLGLDAGERSPRPGRRRSLHRGHDRGHHRTQEPGAAARAGTEDGGGGTARGGRGPRLQQHPQRDRGLFRAGRQEDRRAQPPPPVPGRDPTGGRPGHEPRPAAPRVQPWPDRGAERARPRRGRARARGDAAAPDTGEHRARHLLERVPGPREGRPRAARAGDRQPGGERARRHAAGAGGWRSKRRGPTWTRRTAVGTWERAPGRT